jgi:hypothetical protein
LAGRKPPLEDGASHLLADLTVQRRPRSAVKDKAQWGCFTEGTWHDWYSSNCPNWLFRLYLIVLKVGAAIDPEFPL